MRFHNTLIAFIALTSSLAAQQETKPGIHSAPITITPSMTERTTERRPEDHRLTLDVVVAGKSGKQVSGLPQPSFVVLDNKKPLPVTAFREISGSADPVKVILLIDEVNTNFTSVAYERGQIKQYLKSSGGKLPQAISLVFFSDTGTEMLNGASRDGNALAAALDEHDTSLRTIRRSTGFYGAEDRFQLSIQNLQSIAKQEEGTPGRKLIVWISPGWPYLSGPRVDLSARERQGLFDAIVSMNSALRRARITLSSVDPLGTNDSVSFRTTYWEEFKKGIVSPKDVDAGDLSLQAIAYQTGGRVLNSNNDIAQLIATAIADADHYYELTIEAPPAERADEYHALEVKIEQAGLTARTRTGYYSQP